MILLDRDLVIGNVQSLGFNVVQMNLNQKQLDDEKVSQLSESVIHLMNYVKSIPTHGKSLLQRIEVLQKISVLIAERTAIQDGSRDSK